MSSPAGHALLHGGRRSTYTGRLLRHVPVWLARLEPRSSVMANGFFMILISREAEDPNVAICNPLYRRNRFGGDLRTEQVCKASLQLEIILDRHATPQLVASGNLALLGFEQGEEP